MHHPHHSPYFYAPAASHTPTPTLTYPGQDLPTFRSQLSVAAAGPSSSYHTGSSGYYTANATPAASRPASSAANRLRNNIEVPLVSSNYGYGHTDHVRHMTSATDPSTSRASDYASMMDESSRARRGASSDRGRGGGGKMPRAGRGTHYSHFIREGEAPSTSNAILSSRGRGFSFSGRGPRRPMGRGGPSGRGASSRGGATASGLMSKAKLATITSPTAQSFLSLGRHIAPKPPPMLLTEMTGFHGASYRSLEVTDDDYEEFNEEYQYYPDILHKMQLDLCGSIYTAIAEKKKEARDLCAEKAFPEIIQQQFRLQQERPKQQDAHKNPLPFDQMEDELPYASLLSLAMHRLYTDWQRDMGFEIPEHLLDFSGDGKMGQAAATPAGVATGQQGGALGDKSNLTFKYHDFHGPTGAAGQAQIPMGTPTQQEQWGGGRGRGNRGRGRGGFGSRGASGGGGAGPYGNLGRTPGAPPNLSHRPVPGTVQPPVPGKLIEYPNGKVINPVSKHPVSLLNELLPSLQYQQNQYGSRSSHFVTTIEVKGETYVGESGNKKDSKTYAAVNALKGAFGIEYPAFPTQDYPT